MKNLLGIFLTLCLSVFSYAQEIESGTVFIIEFKNPDKPDFEITYQAPLEVLIDSDFSLDSTFQRTPNENQIFGAFGRGSFGSSQILKSGLENILDYELKISLKGRKRFVKTSTLPLSKNVLAKEIWQDDLGKIKFVRFEKSAPKSFEDEMLLDDWDMFEIKIDSLCLKNPDWNLENGKREFENYLKMIISEFKKETDFKLQKMTEYEIGINSEDATRGHLWGLGKSIYPNEKKFEFDIPITYRRIECPYFEAKRSYFYTKKEKSLKVIDFNWETIDHLDYGIDRLAEGELRNELRQKLPYLEETVSKYLGDPYLNLTEENGRRQIKWESPEGIRGYLFNFTTISEIRLYIYKE